MPSDETPDPPPRLISFKANVAWQDDSIAATLTQDDPEDRVSTTLSLSDVRSTYFEASKKVSETLRQYALAGIAIVWVFRGSGASTMGLDPKLLAAALWVIVSIALDFFQYVLTTYIWFFYFRHREKKDANLSQQFLVSDWWNAPNYTLFSLKVVTLLYAYVRFLLPYIWWRVHH